MKKAFTLPELSISLLLLLLSMAILVGLSFSYLSVLNSIRSKYFALNMAQEGIELAIALRNKQIETSSTPWVGVSTSGSYCLSFNTTTKKIIVISSSNPCKTLTPNYTRLIIYSDFENQSNTNLTIATATKVISKVYFEKNNKVELDVVLTKWHPASQ
jgi:type II secretory pathway pseudopilin PulG